MADQYTTTAEEASAPAPAPGPTTTIPAAPYLLSTHRALVETLASFLTVATHHILYLRRLYPPISFLATRAYNYPVRQNRHPAVCQWILDAVSAVRDQLEKNTVEKVALCIYECKTNRVLERWTFDLHSLPAVAKADRDIPFESAAAAAAAAGLADSDSASEETATATDGLRLARKLNLVDLEANFRATLSRISTAAARLRPLPEGPGAPECSFTLAIQVKDGADRPVGRLEREERKWMAAEPEPDSDPDPDPDPDPEASKNKGKDTSIPSTVSGNHQRTHNPTDNSVTRPAPSSTPSSSRTHAVRRLETGELRVEIWVEESAAKFEYNLPPTTASTASASASGAERRANMSYGAGTERFDPENDGYDLEPADINRKPHGGATTDYQRG